MGPHELAVVADCEINIFSLTIRYLLIGLLDTEFLRLNLDGNRKI